MYVFDEPQENQPEEKYINPTEIIKVKSKFHEEAQNYQMPQQTANNLIFAFEQNEVDDHQPSNPPEKQYLYEPEEEQNTEEKQTQKQQQSRTPEIIKSRDQNTLEQYSPSIKSQTSSLSLLNHKNYFVIERILFFPQKFFLYDHEENLLISARKKLIEINSLFYFFSGDDMSSTKNNNYLGYMIADSSNEYKLYSAHGIPLASFEYSIPKNTPGEIIVCIGNKKGQSEKQIADQVIEEPENLFYLRNRQPEKNPVTGKYFTSLEGLGKVPSCKNCALIYRQKSSLIMGKQKQKNYNLHYGDPWTDFIAFAFAISNYQQKDIQT